MAGGGQARWVRPAVDVAMTVTYALQMAPHQTGATYHEWAGITFAVLFVTHHALNAGWLRHARRRGDAKAWLTIVLDVLMTPLVCGIVLTGVLMSRRAVPFLSVASVAHTVRPLHACLTYLGLILMSLHVGMHAPMLRGYARLSGADAMGSPSIPTRVVLLVATVVGGAWAFARLGVATKLSLGMSFPDGITPLPVLVAEHLLLAAPFVMAGSLVEERLRAARRRR